MKKRYSGILNKTREIFENEEFTGDLRQNFLSTKYETCFKKKVKDKLYNYEENLNDIENSCSKTYFFKNKCAHELMKIFQEYLVCKHDVTKPDIAKLLSLFDEGWKIAESKGEETIKLYFEKQTTALDSMEQNILSMELAINMQTTNKKKDLLIAPYIHQSEMAQKYIDKGKELISEGEILLKNGKYEDGTEQKRIGTMQLEHGTQMYKEAQIKIQEALATQTAGKRKTRKNKKRPYLNYPKVRS